MVNVINEIPPSVVRAKWGWFVALGVLLLVFSLIALGNLFVATVLSVYYVGFLMLLGGIVYLLHSFQVRTWSHVLVWALSGLVYALAGIFTLTNPVLASTVLTLLLAFTLIAAGILRIWVGSGLRSSRGWGWILFGGLVTVLAGVVIALGWPVNSLWILGLFLAIDLFFQGWTLIAYGLVERK